MTSFAAALWLLSVSAQVANSASLPGAGGVGRNTIVRIDWQLQIEHSREPGDHGNEVESLAVDAVGLDWMVDLAFARDEVQSRKPVQGNLDPVVLLAGGDPWQLPPRFRNHCACEYFSARPFCSDHCGRDYQFYYCSPASFGCCHLGRGYCDVSGLLRCHP
jgi:hypothetical protein